MVRFATRGMWRALACALRRRQDGVGPGVLAFRTPPPRVGTIVAVLALVAAVALATAVVVPWPAVQAVVLLLDLWLLGFLVAAVVVGTTHPHLLTADALVLRHQTREVARVPLDRIGTISLETARDAAVPALANGRLHLPGPDGSTDVRVDLLGTLPASFSPRLAGDVRQVTLAVTTPKTLVGEIGSRIPSS